LLLSQDGNNEGGAGPGTNLAARSGTGARPVLGKRKRWRKLRTPPGATPGTLAAAPDAHTTTISLIAYGPEGLDAAVAATPEAIRTGLGKHKNIWIDVVGLSDIPAIEALGEIFRLDRLALEDVLNGNHRPKIEHGDHYDFLIARRVVYDKRFRTEQVSIFFGPGFVVSFHERSSAYLEPVRERITKGRGKIRKAASDYLAYAILDCLVDHYFPPMTRFAEAMADLDERLFHEETDNDFISEVRELRAYLMGFHAVALPLVEVVTRLVANPSGRFAATTKPFLKDCQDHVLQVIDQIDSFRQLSSDLMNQYHSTMTHKLNETMKVLTMIATIFIPLTFITSIYGMNFDTSSPWNMPELHHPFGYPAVMSFMAAMSVAMLIWFQRRGWIPGFPRPRVSRRVALDDKASEPVLPVAAAAPGLSAPTPEAGGK
jgi:magnesium transporter